MSAGESSSRSHSWAAVTSLTEPSPQCHGLCSSVPPKCLSQLWLHSFSWITISQAACRSPDPATHFQASLVFKNSVWKPHMEASTVPQLIFSILVKSVQLDNAHMGHSLRMTGWLNVQKPMLGDKCPPQSESLCMQKLKPGWVELADPWDALLPSLRAEYLISFQCVNIFSK